MCKILHIETATEVCSVNIASSGKLLACRETAEKHSHASILAVYIQELFQETGILPGSLDAVAVSMGPGSYTGLRIGVSVAKGLCYGLDIPLIAVPTLESMCYGVLAEAGKYEFAGDNNILLAPMIDARRMEVYTAVYNLKVEVVKDTHALVVKPDSFNDLLQNFRLIFFGNGSEKIRETIVHPDVCFIPEYQVSSESMIIPAYSRYNNSDFADTAYFEPYYLKDFITTVPGKKITF